jgi:hypothetical protein
MLTLALALALPPHRGAPSSTIRVEAATDAVYRGVSGDVTLTDAGTERGAPARQLTVRAGGGWRDTVIWNPFGAPLS